MVHSEETKPYPISDTAKKVDEILNCAIDLPSDDQTTSDPLINGTKSEDKSQSNNNLRRHSSFFHIPAFHALDDDTFRGKCFRFIRSVNFQVAVIGFVVLDCIFIISELAIDLRITKGNVCDKVTCEPIKKDHSLILILQSISLAILTLFIIELLFKLYVLRFDFFNSKMEVFDYIIVVVSWTLDVVFFHHDEHAMNMLIFLRMWRLVRIIHAIAISMRAPVEHQLEQEKHEHHVTEARLDKLYNYTKELEEEIEDLRNLLEDFTDDMPETKLRRIPTLKLSKKSRLKAQKLNNST